MEHGSNPRVELIRMVPELPMDAVVDLLERARIWRMATEAETSPQAPSDHDRQASATNPQS